MKKLVLSAITGICALHLQANIDSLKHVIKTTTNTNDKITSMHLVAKEFFITNQHDSALVYATSALKMAQKHNHKKGIALSCNILGNVNIIRGNYDEALKLNKRALKIQLELKDEQTAADAYNNIGLIYYYKGEYPEALKSYLNGLKLVKKLGNKNGIARSYSNMGGVYYQMQDVDKALESYENAITIQREINDQVGIGRSLNNIASMYLVKKDYTKALTTFNESIAIKVSTGDVLSIGRSYINMGDIYFLLANENKSIPHKRDSLFNLSRLNFEKSLIPLEKIGDKQAMASTYNNLALLYVQLHDARKAQQQADKGFALATEIGSKDDIKSSYNAYFVIDSVNGNFKQAFAHYKLFVAYRDSLVNDANTKKATETQMNFEFEQKELKMKAAEEKRLALLHEKNLRDKISLWSVAGGIILILLSVVLFINRVRLKQKHRYQQQLNLQQKEQATAIMEAQEQERKRIAEDLHDSLGHLLSTVKMNLQTSSGDEQKNNHSVQLLNQASEELRNISFNLMPRVLEEEGLTPALNELAEKTGKSGKLAVSFQEHDTANLRFDKSTQFNIYRIVQEAINNILKHAGATEAGIQLIRQQKGITIMIEDNGKGFDPREAKKGRGQKNMRVRTQWLNGNFHMDSTPGHGTTISIEIPA